MTIDRKTMKMLQARTDDRLFGAVARNSAKRLNLNLGDAITAYEANPSATTVGKLYRIGKATNPNFITGNSTTARRAGQKRIAANKTAYGFNPTDVARFKALQKDPQFIQLHNEYDSTHQGTSFGGLMAQIGAIVAAAYGGASAASALSGAGTAAGAGSGAVSSAAPAAAGSTPAVLAPVDAATFGVGSGIDTGFAGLGAGTGAIEAGGAAATAASYGVGSGIDTGFAGLGAGALGASTGVSAIFDKVKPALSSTIMGAVKNHGADAIAALSSYTGMQASQSMLNAAAVAKDAALSGNTSALNNALAQLDREFKLRKGAAASDIGASGFRSSSNAGSFYDAILNKLATEQGLRDTTLRTAAEQDKQGILSQYARDVNNANAGKAQAKVGTIQHLAPLVSAAYKTYTGG